MYAPLAPGFGQSVSRSSSRSQGDDRRNYNELHDVELADLADTRLLTSTSYENYRNSHASVTEERSIMIDSETSPSNFCSKSRSFFERAKSTFRSSKTVSNDERASTRSGSSLWTEVMLVDRTLRGMACLTTIFAIVMIAICTAYASRFVSHIHENPHSTSVEISSGSRSSMNRKAEGLKFVINVAATMVLGMSNTYQQLLTALKVDDLKYALFKYGNSRVGTNSPFSINHKRKGRLRAWLAWILLICTSMPIHLLANSVIGVSEYYNTGVNVAYVPRFNGTSPGSAYEFWCYSALRLGHNRIDPKDWQSLLPGDASGSTQTYDSCPANHTDPAPNPFSDNAEDFIFQYDTNMTIYYKPESCSQYVRTADTFEQVLEEFYGMRPVDPSRYNWVYVGNCTTDDFTCIYGPPTAGDQAENTSHSFLLVMRMQAAIILSICLAIKASYMVAVNIKGSHEIKSHCLTFGDILVASNLDPELRIPNESMVNGGDFHRRQVAHVCHKHCRSIQLSDTGEELGHCQYCKKYNKVNNTPGLPWPVVSTKRKKSLITNLGQTALTQMLTLSVCSVGMVATSILLVIIYTGKYAYAVCVSWTTYSKQFATSQVVSKVVINSLWGEIAAFLISNGAQLLYSCLYLLLIYNLSLISMEHDWGKFEKGRQRLRCTIVKSERFDQSYFLQLPKKILFPIMTYSVLMHWLLGLAILAEETILTDGFKQYSRYTVVTVPDAVWGSSTLLLAMMATCWWAFTYKREGYIPQMFGFIRTLCASTTELNDFPMEGVKWGDLGQHDAFRYAGISAAEVGEIVPNEIYA